MRISDWSSDVCSSDLDESIFVRLWVCEASLCETLSSVYLNCLQDFRLISQNFHSLTFLRRLSRPMPLAQHAAQNLHPLHRHVAILAANHVARCHPAKVLVRPAGRPLDRRFRLADPSAK